MKPCECFTPDACIMSCPDADYDYYYHHPDYGPQYIREMGIEHITCRKCGAYQDPDCNRCLFQGSSEYCPEWQNAISEAVKEVRQ